MAPDTKHKMSGDLKPGMENGYTGAEQPEGQIFPTDWIRGAIDPYLPAADLPAEETVSNKVDPRTVVDARALQSAIVSMKTADPVAKPDPWIRQWDESEIFNSIIVRVCERIRSHGDAAQTAVVLAGRLSDPRITDELITALINQASLDVKLYEGVKQALYAQGKPAATRLIMRLSAMGYISLGDMLDCSAVIDALRTCAEFINDTEQIDELGVVYARFDAAARETLLDNDLVDNSEPIRSELASLMGMIVTRDHRLSVLGRLAKMLDDISEDVEANAMQAIAVFLDSNRE